MRPFINQGTATTAWEFGFVGGLDRKSTSSYYTRPDLVQSLIKTTLVPVIENMMKEQKTTEDRIKALLNMKVCDAASGSGHIVLAMARTIAWYLCTLRTGEDNPASLDYREALREVIQKCVYAVDYNPDAVELCKVVLWIEGYCAGKPLSFLDHHIRCGNSVVGITNLDVLLQGVPNDAFNADEKDILRLIKQANQEAIDEIPSRASINSGSFSSSFFSNDFAIGHITGEQIGLANSVKEISALPENSLLEELTKQKRWENLMLSPRVECLRRACDIYTYSFYHQFSAEDLQGQYENIDFVLPDIPYTRTVYHALEEIKHLEESTSDFVPLSDEFKNRISTIAKSHSFFHWCVEFPEVFVGNGGFDVMCGNPPWDKIKVEDKKWFESHGRADIVNAGTAAQRKRAIANLPISDPILYDEYCQAQHEAEAMSRFVRFSGRFALTAKGDIDLYPMFAELCLSFSREAWGLVMPTGIAINDSTKDFFAKLVEENRLISLYDFENREALFDIHRMFKFCLLTAGKKQDNTRTVSAGFYLTRLDHLLDPNRIYTLKSSDIALMNPNTKTCSVFRTSRDASLTASIYRRVGILMNENTGSNPWDIKFNSMFHMSNDSHIFKTYQQLTELGAEYSNGIFKVEGEIYVPLYEGKMIWHYNHHFGIWPTDGDRPNAINSPSIETLQNPDEAIIPWFWVPMSEVNNRLITINGNNQVVWEWKHNYLLGFRDITNATNERTFVPSLIPSGKGVGNSTTLLYVEGAVANTLVLATMSSIPFDYVAKQKVGGSHASISFVKQFPILTLEQIPERMIMPIVSRVTKLCYFNHDLDCWAEELWNELTFEQQKELPELGRKECYIFDSDKRAVLQAELDAIFAHLYGLSTEDLRYILDPEDVLGPGCINETFRVLKEREFRELGEYRTKRLVMEAWYKFGYDN